MVSGSDLFLLAGFHKGAEELSLGLGKTAGMLRMPLDANTELVTGLFDGFVDAVFRRGGGNQRGSNRIHCLMVQTVDGDLFSAQDSVELSAGADCDPVVAGSSALPVVVIAAADIFDILMKRASEIHVHQLMPPADAEDGLACGEKCFQHFHFRVVSVLGNLTAFFRYGLTVVGGVHILMKASSIFSSASSRGRLISPHFLLTG